MVRMPFSRMLSPSPGCGHALACPQPGEGESILENGILTMRDSEVEFDLQLQAECPQVEVSAEAVDAQRKRDEKEREQLIKNIANHERQLSDEKFLGRAPAHVIESLRQKLAEYKTQLGKLDSGAQ